MLSANDRIDREEALRKPMLGQSQVTCDIMWTFPLHSCHSCNYGTLIGCWTYIPCATSIHKCRRCYTSKLTETLLQCSEIRQCVCVRVCVGDFDLYYLLRIPVHQYCSRTMKWVRILVIPLFRYLNKEIIQICILPYWERSRVYTLVGNSLLIFSYFTRFYPVVTFMTFFIT